MKRILFLLLILLSVLVIYAQDTPKTVIVCTYNYKLPTKERVIDESNVRYLISTYDKTSSITLLEKNDFSSTLEEAFSKKNILLFVHGDDFDIDKLAMRSTDISELYNVNTICFAWSSYKTSRNSIKNYNISKKNVDLCFSHFLQLVDSLNNYVIKNNVKASVIFHSLGNIFAQKYASFLENNLDKYQPFTNVIINSACVLAKDHAFWIDILCRKTSNKVYITVNKNDKILKLASTFIEYKPLLGKNPGRNTSQNAYYIDFTNVLKNVSNDKKMPSSHTYFISYPPRENSEIKNFYDKLFNSDL